MAHRDAVGGASTPSEKQQQALRHRAGNLLEAITDRNVTNSSTRTKATSKLERGGCPASFRGGRHLRFRLRATSGDYVYGVVVDYDWTRPLSGGKPWLGNGTLLPSGFTTAGLSDENDDGHWWWNMSDSIPENGGTAAAPQGQPPDPAPDANYMLASDNSPLPSPITPNPKGAEQ